MHLPSSVYMSGQSKLFRADLWSQFCCSISEPLSQAAALALMPSPAWGPPDTLTQLMKKANTSLLACAGIECKLNQTPGDSNAMKSGLLNNDSNWLWGCREKGSLEANRNLNKDYCATCLCCGTLRTWSWGFHVTSQCLNISYIAFLWK